MQAVLRGAVPYVEIMTTETESKPREKLQLSIKTKTRRTGLVKFFSAIQDFDGLAKEVSLIDNTEHQYIVQVLKLANYTKPTQADLAQPV